MADEADQPWFVDVTGQSGIEFVYHNGSSGEYYFPEIIGGGAALFDYNDNGKLDLYLVQGSELGPDTTAALRSRGDRLFRNDSEWVDGEWRVRFTDVTEAAGIDARGYGMGVAVGDINNNGYPDLYVLNYGENQLWRNNGDGSFTDITREAGVNDSRWSVSASFADITGNGRQDLFVTNYVEFDFDNHQRCRGNVTARDYCAPSVYDGVGDSLFANRGEERFEDISEKSDIPSRRGRGLGVITDDFNGNGRTDVYVANDADPNFYWLNEGNEKFREDAMLAGNAVNADGATEAGMGVAAADFNRSGANDIFITHLKGETNTLYVNDGQGWFDDRTTAFGLGSPSIPFTGFGTAWVDIERNGWLDLVAVNGAVMKEERLVSAGEEFPYAQTNQIFTNREGERFVETTSRGGEAFTQARVSRGAAFGDINNNGRVDMVIVNINGPARLLLNQAGGEHHWLGLELFDSEGSIRQTGATACLVEEDGARPCRRSRTDGSYASANDPRIVFGLGPSAESPEVEVRWSNGQKELFSDLTIDRYNPLRQGSGKSLDKKLDEQHE